MQFTSQRRRFVKKKKTITKLTTVTESKIEICSSELPSSEWYQEKEEPEAVWKESRIQIKYFQVS